MEKYVLGFAFNSAKNYVVLIKKNKPKWQKGCFNGVGGKIEGDEIPAEAMVREFKEETGLETTMFQWIYLGTMGNSQWICHLFTSHGDGLMKVETTTDEEVSVFPVEEVLNGDYRTISNIPFLIELCRDAHRPQKVSLTYAE